MNYTKSSKIATMGCWDLHLALYCANWINLTWHIYHVGCDKYGQLSLVNGLPNVCEKQLSFGFSTSKQSFAIMSNHLMVHN